MNTVNAIIPCDHPSHIDLDYRTFDDGWDPAAYCHPPYPFGSRRNHRGARVVELTQETDTLTVHTKAEPLHYDVEKKTRWVSEWEDGEDQ